MKQHLSIPDHQTKNSSSVSINTFFQPKLFVNQPNDNYEQEADAMADKVMRMPGNGKKRETFFKPAISLIQRKCEHCEEEEKKIQRKENNNEAMVSSSNENYINSLSGGKALTQNERSFFEPRMNHDFKNIRIHTDSMANESAKDLNAIAYTNGNNIVFASNQYEAGTYYGKQILAHELTHVIQQQKGIHKHSIQRLKVNPHGTFTKGSCGQYEKFWIFELASPAPEDGYIVQQVDLYEDFKTCPMTAVDLLNPTFTFWEAWWLQRGDKRQHIHSKVGFTDRAALDAHPNQSASHAAIGTIKFFKKSVTGDLGKENVVTSDPAITWRPGNQGGVQLSGWLPSTSSPPAWWGNSTEGPEKRYAYSDWYCCGTPAKQWSTSSARP